jgi:AraC family transcriptional regulator of adaptative response/methylated-DNA-[protein]-cysteine methyltransferase
METTVVQAIRDEDRWAAVLAKDAERDGEFVFAVKTTGIYCRPSCPARPAKRENVTFFDTTAQAAQAGYRACKRCKPDGASQDQQRQAVVLQACQAIERRIDLGETSLSLDDLAAQMGLSPHHFHRIFKASTGLTPRQYHKAVQSRRVAGALQGAPSVTAAIYDAGFSSSGRFYEEAAGNLGMSPSRFRQGAAGERIRYAVEPSPLGMMLVAATQRGVCAIEFADDQAALVAGLKARFPKATFEPGDAPFRQWVGQILAYLDLPKGSLDLPLDVQGTAFQRRVWQALREIPSGQTVSYSELAQRLGQASAVRAVASACANNAIAVAIPCHRVVRTGGALAGYRWGVARKAELLRRESDES